MSVLAGYLLFSGAGSGSTIYINEDVTIDELIVGVYLEDTIRVIAIEDTIPVVAIEEITVIVHNIDVL